MSIVQTDCQHCQTGTRDGVEQPPEQAHFMASSQAATEPSKAMSTLMNAYIYKNKGLFFSLFILIRKVWVIFVILHFDHMIAEKYDWQHLEPTSRGKTLNILSYIALFTFFMFNVTATWRPEWTTVKCVNGYKVAIKGPHIKAAQFWENPVLRYLKQY